MLVARLSHAVVTAVVGLAVHALALPAMARADGLSFDPAAVYQVATGDGPSRGPADAPVTIVEWSDYACRYCNVVNATLEQVDRLFPGRLRWVYRTMPLDDDETLAAEAGLAAAAQGRFWPMHDRLFAAHGRVDRATVELFAAGLGLDMTRFRADLDSRAYRRQVLIDNEAARALGVTGTPMFFVNGRPIRGNQPLLVFTRTIDEELTRADTVRAAGSAGPLYPRLIAEGRASADAPSDAMPEVDELDPQSTYRVGLGLPGHADGPADALVTVVVWSDFECPYCVRTAPVLARLRQEYGDKVRVVHRHLPLPMHPHAQLAAEAAVAASVQGKFWPMYQRLFAHADQLTRADLEDDARAIGLDLALFRRALDERRYHDAVAADAAAGNSLAINGTPTLFVNGTPIPGAPRYDHLKALVDARLLEAERMVASGVARQDVYGLIMLAAHRLERGDPSRMPAPSSVGTIELGQGDRELAVEAACRARDGARAKALSARLKGARRGAAAGACAALGIDL